MGIFLTVTWSWIGALTILSPLLMIWLLTAKTAKTGKALAEQRMSATRPGDADYVARTSGFFPLPPKKGATDGAVTGVRPAGSRGRRRP